MIPTDVTGFVIEAMRNTVPLDIGMPLATSCLPKALRYRIESLFVTAATTPGISPWSTAAWNMRSIAAAPLGLRVGGPADCAVQPRATRIASHVQLRRIRHLLPNAIIMRLRRRYREALDAGHLRRGRTRKQKEEAVDCRPR